MTRADMNEDQTNPLRAHACRHLSSQFVPKVSPAAKDEEVVHPLSAPGTPLQDIFQAPSAVGAQASSTLIIEGAQAIEGHEGPASTDASSAADAAGASTAAEREDVSSITVKRAHRETGDRSNPVCDQCGRAFPPKKRGAMISHQNSCTNGPWVAPVKPPRPLASRHPSGSRARAQLLDSQGFAMQWLSANRWAPATPPHPL